MAVYSAGPESDLSESLVTHSYTLTISAPTGTGSGTTTPATGAHTYIEGKSVLIVASPAQDSAFKGWEGSEVEDSSSETTRVVMDSNKTINARFNSQYVLTIVSTSGGTTNPAPSSAITYDSGKVVQISAIPADGYEFKEWTVDGVASGTSDTLSVTMSADKIVGATFSEAEAATDSSKHIYYAKTNKKAFWNVDGVWTFFATTVHGLLKDLDKDDHAQYLNNERHDTTDRHTLGTVVAHDSHTNLSDIGTNTHAQIDSHIGATNNPHSGALSKLSGSALPTASGEYRGQFFTVNGLVGPPAVADGLYYCRSTDGGTTFEWKQVSLI